MMAEHRPKHVANNSVNMLKKAQYNFLVYIVFCLWHIGVSGLVFLLYSFYWSQGPLGFIQKRKAPQQTAAV